jgi:hypothetical protein
MLLMLGVKRRQVVWSHGRRRSALQRVGAHVVPNEGSTTPQKLVASSRTTRGDFAATRNRLN